MDPWMFTKTVCASFLWAVTLLVVGVAAGYGSQWRAAAIEGAAPWIQAEGRILESELIESEEAGATVLVTFSYVMTDGRTRFSNTIHPTKYQVEMAKAEAERIVEKYEVGEPCIVAVNADDWDEAYLEHEETTLEAGPDVLYFLGLIAFAAGCGALLYPMALLVRRSFGMPMPCEV